MSLSDERKSLPIHSVNWKSFPQFILFEEDVKKHTQAFIERLKESLMINQEEKTDIIDEINKEMFDKIDKIAEEEFGDLAK